MPSYEKSKSSGLWSCRFREVDENGIAHNMRLSGFKTKKEAQFGYEDHIKARDAERARKIAEAQVKADPNDMPFDDLLRDYLGFTQKRTKETSFYDIEKKIQNNIAPVFCGKRMKDISPKMISDWIEGLDYAYKTKKWLFSTLISIYRYGDRYYEIKNTIQKVDPPKNMELPKEMKVWTPEQLATVLPYVKHNVYRLYYLTLYVTGCRRGEGAALTWDDFADQSLRINKSISSKSKKASYVVTTPKTKKSIRTLSIPTYLNDALEQHKLDQQAELGERWRPSLLIFGGEKPLPFTSVDRYFKTATKLAEVDQIRIHDLRHSCASLLIHRGISVVAVSRHLGHSTIEQTLKTYAHLFPDDTSKIQNTLEDLGTEIGTKI